MNFYISARFNNKEEVNKIKQIIEKNGHKVVSTWTEQKIIKPYNEKPRDSQKYAKLCLKEIEKSNVFVLLSDKEGTGMYFELGFAFYSFLNKKSPKIYVIGNYLSRSMFYFLPNVKLFPSINLVIHDLQT